MFATTRQSLMLRWPYRVEADTESKRYHDISIAATAFDEIMSLCDLLEWQSRRDIVLQTIRGKQ